MSLWLAVATLVAAGVWLLGAGVADLRRRPPSPPPARRRSSWGRRRPRWRAVDDGASDVIRASGVGAHHLAGLEQSRLVTVRTSRSLGCLRWIIPAEASGAAL